MAKLYFFYGAMNAGKSTQLLQISHNYYEMGYNTAIFKPEVDTKSPLVVSRLGISHKVDRKLSKNDNVFEISKNFSNVKCFLVDEAQFLTENQVDDLWHIAVKRDIPVMAFGLRTDFRMNGFPGSRRLMEISHSIVELKTMCPCGKRKAVVNLRINKKTNIPILQGEQLGIDNNAEIGYISICGECFIKVEENQNQPIEFTENI